MEEKLDEMREEYEERIVELKNKLRVKKQERNKYKKKAEDLKEQIERLKSVDWQGDIVREYEDSEGTICYDIRWKISKELYAEDVRQEDLDKWEEVKQQKKKKSKKSPKNNTSPKKLK